MYRLVNVLLHSSFQRHLQVEKDHFWSLYDIPKLALMPHHGILYEFHWLKIVEIIHMFFYFQRMLTAHC